VLLWAFAWQTCLQLPRTSTQLHQRSLSRILCETLSWQWAFNLIVSMLLRSSVQPERRLQIRRPSRGQFLRKGLLQFTSLSNNEEDKENKAPSRAGWLGGVSLVMFSHRNNRKHQASIFCGSIPQHNTKQHQGSENRCYVRWTSRKGV
jgi:hypothetical protein